MIRENTRNLYAGCTHGELGQAYAPNDTPDSARRMLMRWSKFHPTLLAELRTTGYVPGARRRLTPLQVKMIFDALGTPS